MLSGNRKLAEMVGGVLNQMTRIFNLGLDLRDSADEMMQEHTALIAAITLRDVDQAVALVDQQIRTSRQRVVEMLGQYLNREALAKLV
jgi:DNA-binding GntR family transcriptional regulator